MSTQMPTSFFPFFSANACLPLVLIERPGCRIPGSTVEFRSMVSHVPQPEKRICTDLTNAEKISGCEQQIVFVHTNFHF